MKRRRLLGVNIDHIATLRQARRELFPDPVEAALVCEKAGCDSIVCHLREDRRHINDRDVRNLRSCLKTRLNLEMSIAKGIVDVARDVRPDQATLVPERRQEVTTEGGLDVSQDLSRVRRTVLALAAKGIPSSLFIDPVKKQVDAAVRSGARIVEIHTGAYARARTRGDIRRELYRLAEMVGYARSEGLTVNVGHGLDYENVSPLGAIDGIHEFNIGYAIIARAVFVGLDRAVRQMLGLIR